MITSVRALSAERRPAWITLIVSAVLSLVRGVTVSLGAKAACAAVWASMGSDLPLNRRAVRAGLITSTTVMPWACRWRVNPAPYEFVPSTPTT